MRNATNVFFTTVTLCIGSAEVAHADVWGLKSSSGDPASQPPTHFVRITENGATFADIGAVTIGKTEIDADGLAIAPASSLFAFHLQAGGSTLISIDSTTAVATSIGDVLTGRAMRGATFDLNGLLWAVDSAADQLLQIDPATGAIVGAPVAITRNAVAFDVHVVTDLAVRSDGAMLLLSQDEPMTTDTVFGIDVATGALTMVGALPGANPGATFSGAASSQDHLFTFQVHGCDDVNRSDVAACFARTTLRQNIIPLYYDCPEGTVINPNGFNSGLGDLAAIVLASAANLQVLGIDCDSNGLPDCLDISAGGSPDCNANGTADCIDIAFGFASDCNGNGVPDECQTPCPYDGDNSGTVNIDDLLGLISAWGTCPN